MERRSFVKKTAVIGGCLLSSQLEILASASGRKKPVIMIVSGWQDVNIGDIAHTPGLIALLKKNMPGSRLIREHQS